MYYIHRSKREMDLILMRKRLLNLQQRAFVCEMQCREFCRIDLISSCPYQGLDEETELYSDYMAQFKDKF